MNDANAYPVMHQGDVGAFLDTDFDSLVIDKSKTMGIDLFRLAENCTAICVSEKENAAVEQHEIPGMLFYGTGEWSG